MYSWVYKYLVMNSVLYIYQFGFRKKHTTALALMEVSDSIHHNLDEGNRCCDVYLDVPKAQDLLVIIETHTYK